MHVWHVLRLDIKVRQIKAEVESKLCALQQIAIHRPGSKRPTIVSIDHRSEPAQPPIPTTAPIIQTSAYRYQTESKFVSTAMQDNRS